MARLFTPKIASYYENFYQSKGVKFIKGTVLSSFEIDSNGKVNIVVILRKLISICEIEIIFKHALMVLLIASANLLCAEEALKWEKKMLRFI